MDQVNITAAKLECGEEEFFLRRSSFVDSKKRQFTEETYYIKLNPGAS